MATMTDAAVAATTNVGRDQNPGSTGLPTPTMTFVVNLVAVTSVVNPVATPAVLGGLLNHHERPKKFTRVNFKR
ncbi:hypothetical protein CsSME_00038146 [Camellia sinensis var. sinensis]